MLKLGDSTVTIIEYSHPGPEKVAFFAPHGDEKTGVQAAIKVISQRGGRVLEIKSVSRLLTFTVGGAKFTIDPNRIFTEEGTKNTLGKYSTVTEPALTAVRKFSKQLIALINEAMDSLWVAVHNNGDGALSVLNVLPAQQFLELYRYAGADADDFLLCTAKGDFDKLKEAAFNVVLQDSEQVTDDGSLSVYCGHNQIEYINVEAQHGHSDAQARMIEAVIALRGSGHTAISAATGEPHLLPPKIERQPTEN